MTIIGRVVRRVVRMTGHEIIRPFAAPRVCPICGYQGRFYPFGRYYIRPDAVCGGCGSLERHRQLYLVLHDQATKLPPSPRLLHFAPEESVAPFLRKLSGEYLSADLFGPADRGWNIEQIDCLDSAFDVIVCSHVLEHVNVEKALREIERILRPGGVAFLMIPICEGMDATYENPAVRTEKERWLHFQQPDHVRLFGRDFRDKVRTAGFDLSEDSAWGEKAVKYGLVPGETVFIARSRKAGAA